MQMFQFMQIYTVCMEMFRLSKEIIADLPTIYDMPPEAVNWIKEMIRYNVAGNGIEFHLIRNVLGLFSWFHITHGLSLSFHDECLRTDDFLLQNAFRCF